MNPSLLALRRGALLTLTMLLAFVLAACASGDADASEPANGDTGGGTVSVTGGVVAISADELVFDADVIQATAGEAFTVTFTNNEAAQHNWSIYTEEGGEMIAQGNIIGEGATDEIEVPALEPGEYFFVCDVHPADMVGTVVVEG